MRRLVLLICCTLVSTGASFAQNTSENYLTYVRKQDSIRQSFWQKKQFLKAIGVLQDMHKRFEALNSAEQAAQVNIDVSITYNIACAYALLDSTDQALHFLKLTIDKGYNNYNNLKRDSDLVSLWKMKPFEDLLAIVRERGDHTVVLKTSGAYHSAIPSRPAFTYEQPNESSLVRLRTMFHLDSVAGSGDEISRIIRLMRWAHHVVRHDGSSQNPASRNAIDLIAICNSEKRGVNCRMMATILNEAYLAMGFRSRHVTCLPKDTSDFDCHVINSVYSTTLHKWLWMDPTFEGYMTDKSGTLLSIAEVRAKMIAGDSVYVSDGLNWNGQPYNKEAYLDYMAKNLYWFFCPVSSEFGYESKKGRHVYVNLLPDSYNPEGKVLEAMNEKGGYYTNDADYFWEGLEKH